MSSSQRQQQDDAMSSTSMKNTSSNNVANVRYTYDEAKLQELKKSCPWTRDAKYFTKVALSPCALVKIMMHCHSGVEKGIQEGNGNPVEVMGMLLGRPDPTTPRTLIVTDAFPLPIEGFETRVIADDEGVMNHMISLGECLEQSRKEKFMGWYHSHPFDVTTHSHCYLSQTDLSTQLQWQRAEDPHGNPFVAIVVDPLRSLSQSNPELKAFRAFPPEYSSSVPNQCPDGSIIASQQVRLEHWGSCWNRYYELQIEYYMSSSARHVMEQLTQDYLWIRTLGGNNQNKNSQEHVVSGLADSTSKIQSLDLSALSKTAASGTASSGGGGSMFVGAAAGAATSSSTTTNTGSDDANTNKGLEKACQQVVDIATAQLVDQTIQGTKQEIFGKYP